MYFCSENIREKLFSLSLVHAMNHGFNERAILQACQDLQISSASCTIIKPIDLIHFSMKKWNRDIIDKMTFDEKFKEFRTSGKIKFLIKERLQLQSPYMGRWNEAMAEGAKQPQETGGILWQYADDCWYLAGDYSNEYARRLMFLYIYISTESFMLTDKSPNFFMTWEFLERRMEDIKCTGNYIDLSKNMFNTLFNAGYYMGTMFRHFPEKQQIKNQNK